MTEEAEEDWGQLSAQVVKVNTVAVGKVQAANME